MKTNYFIKEKSSIYTLFGLLALVVTSCGSYQNKSYYDNDGIYGGNEKKAVTVATEENTNSAYYKEYFSSLNKENEEIFTNVDEYNSYQNDTIKRATAQVQNTNYSSWGSNGSDNITVNVYDNSWGYGGWNGWYGNNWGWNGWYGPSWGFGWNNWYGPSWGYGGWYGSNWGWGWNGGWYGNNWGWNNNWYGNNYAYSYGRRDSRVYNNYSAGRTSNNRIDRSINSPSRRNYNSTYTTRNTSIRNSGVRSTTRNDSYSTTRPNSGNTTRNYNNTSTPRNNSTPRNVTTPNNTPRSYTPSSNSGGGRSSGGGGSYGGGGGGGGRSSGGGGRR